MKNVLLVIMDGYGIAPPSESNAVFCAKTPNIDNLLKKWPHTCLNASGEYVGLPKGQMGNSEVGHMNIGAGRIVYQDLTYINKCISDDSFFKNDVLDDAFKKVVFKKSTLHLMGLFSDGGVHSHIEHLFLLLQMAKRYEIKDVCIHIWSDGRDVPPKSILKYIADLKSFINKNKIGRIATLCGRYYAMDRDNNKERTQKAFAAIKDAKGHKVKSLEDAVNMFYDLDITDEFFTPCVMQDYKGIDKDDAIVCFNYRSDRARQITKMFINTDCIQKYVCFTQYDANIPYENIAFKPRTIVNSLGEYISLNGLSQLRIAETEKYAHVTFFFNIGKEKTYKNEHRIIVESPKVKTYDLKPEMSAKKITTQAIEAISSNEYNLIVLNFANPDMVGHTGNFRATVEAIETVDVCIGKLIDAINKVNAVALITADHGNAERMRDENGNLVTSHTSNLVPFIAVNCDKKIKHSGSLCDIAPTILEILDLQKPKEMTGDSLIY